MAFFHVPLGMTLVSCRECGIAFGVPAGLLEGLPKRAEKPWLWCPNGHPLYRYECHDITPELIPDEQAMPYMVLPHNGSPKSLESS